MTAFEDPTPPGLQIRTATACVPVELFDPVSGVFMILSDFESELNEGEVARFQRCGKEMPGLWSGRLKPAKIEMASFKKPQKVVHRWQLIYDKSGSLDMQEITKVCAEGSK